MPIRAVYRYFTILVADDCSIVPPFCIPGGIDAHRHLDFAMAGWLHGVFVGEWPFFFPQCGFSLSLFCNTHLDVHMSAECQRAWRA